LTIVKDVLSPNDGGKMTALGLLDLSAAFDAVDHGILLSRPETDVGVKDTSLSWFRSYLSGRRCCAGELSSSRTITCVPQGSVLGSLLFCLCNRPLKQVIKRHTVSHHF